MIRIFSPNDKIFTSIGISDLKTEIVQVRDRMDELEKKIDNMKISEEEKEQLKEALAARRL